MKRMPHAIRPPNAEAIAAAMNKYDMRNPISSRLYLFERNISPCASYNVKPNLPISQHQRQARKQKPLKQPQQETTNSQSGKVPHEPIRETNDSPAKCRRGNDSLKTEPLHDQRGGQFGEDVQRVEEGDGRVELDAGQVDVGDHALRCGVAYVAFIERFL